MDKYRISLQAIAAIGVLGCWGRTLLDGTLPALLTALHGSKPYVLPGTEQLLKTRITGIYYPFDYLLNILVVFFWEAVDGSHPTTSAIGIYFLVQYFSILTVFMTEGVRAGGLSKEWTMSTIVWLLIFQATGVGCTGPLFVMLFLAASPFLRATSQEDMRLSSLASPAALYAIPASLLLCYIGPAILMGLKSPSLVTVSFKESAVILWNTFPLWLAAGQTLFEAAFKSYSPQMGSLQIKSSEHMTAVRIINTIALVISFVGHASFIGLALANSAFSNVFAPEYRSAFTFYNLFVPPFGWIHVKTVGDGVRGFMLWDQAAGYTAMIILAYAQLEKLVQIQGRRYKWIAGALAGAASLLALGPGATCLLTSWVKEELLHEEAEKREAEQNPHKVLLN